MDLLGSSPRLRLDEPAWPIPASRGTARRSGPAGDSLISSSATIRGRVQHSVIFDGVEVGRDAELVDTVVLPGAAIGAGCRLRGVIVDSGCRVPDGTSIDRSAGGTVPIARLNPTVLTAGTEGAAAHSSAYAAA